MTRRFFFQPALLGAWAALGAASALGQQTIYPMQPVRETRLQQQPVETMMQPISDAQADDGYAAPTGVIANLPRPDVDIDDLSARIVRAGADWRMDVEYDVDVEDARFTQQPLHLVFSIRDDQGLLADTEGRPFDVMIPLDRPSDADGDDLEFEAGTALSLPDGAFAWPHRLVLEAVVLDPRDHAILAADSTKVSYREPVYYEPAPVVVGSPAVIEPYPSTVYVSDPYPVVVADPYPSSLAFGASFSFGRSHCVTPYPSYHRRTVVVRRPDHRVVVRSPGLHHSSPRVGVRSAGTVHRSTRTISRTPIGPSRPTTTIRRATINRPSGAVRPSSRPPAGGRPGRRP